MPKGGFGNLIVLPLQKRPRERGTSVLLDELFWPYSDQWGFLKSIRKLSIDQLAQVAYAIVPEENPIGVHLYLSDEDEGEPDGAPSPLRRSKEQHGAVA